MDHRRGERFWEIDFLRGISIILMIGFHGMYDISSLKLGNINLDLPFFIIWQRMTAVLFLLLAGSSLTFTRNRFGKEKAPQLFQKLLKRGGWIFGWGVMVTLVTWLFLRKGFVIFGVLHLIGLSVILSYPFLEATYLNLPLGLAVVIIGVYLNRLEFPFPWLVWVGFEPQHFYSVDYFPVFPWFGIILWGIFLGNLLYRNHGRKLPLPDLTFSQTVRSLCFLGRNSLWIYLIHQPLLFLGLSLFKH